MKPEQLSYYIINRYGTGLTAGVERFAEEIGLKPRQVWRMLAGDSAITLQTEKMITLLSSRIHEP